MSITDSPRNYYRLASGLLQTCRELVADLTKVGNRFGACRLPNGLNFGYRIAPGFGRFIRGKTTPIHGADTPRPLARLRRVYQKARDNASSSSPYVKI